MSAPQTLFDRLWARHQILQREDGMALMWVDRHLVHEGSHHAFAQIGARRLTVAHPELTLGVVDHYAPTRSRQEIEDPETERMIELLETNTRKHGIDCFGLTDPRQGIVHVIGPEQGLTLPGLLICCGDSHTSTHGAFGAIAFGIGATEVAHVLTTQTVWQRKPRTMRITVDGRLGPGVGAKDIALNWIAELGSDGARGHAIEYAGSAIRALSMEARMTLCNLSIEGGGRLGMVAPDQTTLDYVCDRPYAPQGAGWQRATEDWAELKSDETAQFDREVLIDASDIAPIVTWGTSPDQALPITAAVPVPGNWPSNAEQTSEALAYMGLRPAQKLDGLAIDRVFIGSCTNGRIEDLRAAAAVLNGRNAKVPGMVSPGSSLVKQQAEEEGLDQIFRAAGLEWVASGCSMCVGMNGDLVAPGERCASSTNRNFRGRQGPGARTHLMSPAMVAAAAVRGALTDVRPLLQGRNL